MSVVRIVANLATGDVQGVAAFYSDLLSLNILMDMGWIVTLGADELAPVQLSVASTGGSGSPVPDLSVQVSDLAEVFERAEAMGVPITYPITEEPWGIRRFMVHDPMGRLINITEHI